MTSGAQGRWPREADGSKNQLPCTAWFEQAYVYFGTMTF